MNARRVVHPLRSWLPPLVLVLSLAFQTGCKNRKTVINQAAPQAPTTNGSLTGNTNPTGTQTPPACDPSQDPDCPSSFGPSDLPTDTSGLDPSMMGGPGVHITVVNNGVIRVGRGRGRGRRRGPPCCRFGQRCHHGDDLMEDDMELVGDAGEHDEVGMPDEDTDLSGDDDAATSDECADLDAQNDPNSSCNDDADGETEPELEIVDLDEQLEVARNAATEAERLLGEAQEAAEAAKALATEVQELTELAAAEDKLAEVHAEADEVDERLEAIDEQFEVLDAAVEKIEGASEQDGLEAAKTEGQELRKTVEGYMSAVEGHQDVADQARDTAEAHVDTLRPATGDDDQTEVASAEGADPDTTTTSSTD